MNNTDIKKILENLLDDIEFISSRAELKLKELEEGQTQ